MAKNSWICSDALVICEKNIGPLVEWHHNYERKVTT